MVIGDMAVERVDFEMVWRLGPGRLGVTGYAVPGRAWQQRKREFPVRTGRWTWDFLEAPVSFRFAFCCAVVGSWWATGL